MKQMVFVEMSIHQFFCFALPHTYHHTVCSIEKVWARVVWITCGPIAFMQVLCPVLHPYDTKMTWTALQNRDSWIGKFYEAVGVSWIHNDSPQPYYNLHGLWECSVRHCPHRKGGKGHAQTAQKGRRAAQNYLQLPRSAGLLVSSQHSLQAHEPCIWEFLLSNTWKAWQLTVRMRNT